MLSVAVLYCRFLIRWLNIFLDMHLGLEFQEFFFKLSIDISTCFRRVSVHMVNDVIVLFRIMKSRSNIRSSKRKISIQMFFILTKEIFFL